MRKMLERATFTLQESYRNVWGQRWCSKVLANSSHLMVWSDNDVTNDFTVLNKDGTQAFSPEYLRVATRVYHMYQRQLRTPDFVPSELGPAPTTPTRLKEWVEQAYDWCSVFMIDMRGNLIDDAGIVHAAPTMSDEQKAALQAAFASPGVRCMILAAEIPFVGPTPEGARAGAEKLPFLTEHWAYKLDELLWVLDLCFDWKAASAGREVILLGGDIHVGVKSEITDAQSGLKIRHVTTSPITNAVSPFFNPLEGHLSDRYSYTHQVLDGLHNYAQLDLRLGSDGMTVEADIELIGVPIPES